MCQLLDELQIMRVVAVQITCQDSNISEELKHAPTPTPFDLHVSCNNQVATKLKPNT